MWRLALLAFLSSAAAQIPSLGWCPDYQPMANFNMKRFLGTWFEAERYFTVSELVSRCVTTKYESTPEGRILVSNEITNSLTGMKRVLDGHLQMIGREGEGRIIVKYAALPIPYDTEYSILDTDYDSYAVMWSCSGIGPVHTQNAWVLTRERLAPIATMQAAYGVLDRFKISRTFFVKTNQADCNILPDPAAKEQEGKHANVEVEEKSAMVPEVPEKVIEQPVEKRVDPEVKPEVVPEERSAVPVPADEPKPMQVPELIMSESSEKKEEKMSKPEEMPAKEDKKEEMPAKADMPEMMENASKEKDKMEEKRE
ncbi:apolipoprotein D-like isoform X2 [Pectinophora gossypiella]|uniref:apolipoprotein D-like isoform X2 n=1 Tax=Pectinophora gossypiella TaxID=13191 RepID=UPI00214E2707|nr:apolipoprotein D-like isoform X2 [Pectinophora gossypiella]